MDVFESFVNANNIEVVYICTSADGAQDVANIIQKTKVKAIWNFAPVVLRIPENIILQDTHFYANLAVIVNKLEQSEPKLKKVQ